MIHADSAIRKLPPDVNPPIPASGIELPQGQRKSKRPSMTAAKMKLRLRYAQDSLSLSEKTGDTGFSPWPLNLHLR